MTPEGLGRHCAHCCKTVIDFTTWSDAALYKFFATHQGDVCGRFLSTQTDRPIHIPHQPHSRLYRMTIALGLTLIFTQGTSVHAQSIAPLAVQTIPAPNQNNNCAEIKGKVVDKYKEPLPEVKVIAFQGGTEKGSSQTDFDGNYTIKLVDPGFYDLHVFFENRTWIIVTRLVAAPSHTTIQNAIVDTTDTATRIIPYKKPLLNPQGGGDTIKYDYINSLPISTYDTENFGTLTPSLYVKQGAVLVDYGHQRANGTLYIIDGVPVTDIVDIPVKKKRKRWHLFRK
jgi:hypothetical protein